MAFSQFYDQLHTFYIQYTIHSTTPLDEGYNEKSSMFKFEEYPLIVQSVHNEIPILCRKFSSKN